MLDILTYVNGTTLDQVHNLRCFCYKIASKHNIKLDLILLLFFTSPFRHQVNKWHGEVTWFCIIRDIDKI